jgi:hypothetical protein
MLFTVLLIQDQSHKVLRYFQSFILRSYMYWVVLIIWSEFRNKWKQQNKIFKKIVRSGIFNRPLISFLYVVESIHRI